MSHNALLDKIVGETLKAHVPQMLRDTENVILERLIRRHNEREDARWAAGAGDVSMGLTIEAPYPGWPRTATMWSIRDLRDD